MTVDIQSAVEIKAAVVSCGNHAGGHDPGYSSPKQSFSGVTNRNPVTRNNDLSDKDAPEQGE